MIKPGDMVRIDPDRKMKSTDFFTVTSQAGRIYDPNNKILGKFMSDDVAIIIYADDHDQNEMMILSSTGLLGWCYTTSFVIV